MEDAKQKYFAKVGRTLSNPSTGSKLYWSLVNKMLNKAKIPEIPLFSKMMSLCWILHKELKYLMTTSFCNARH